MAKNLDNYLADRVLTRQLYLLRFTAGEQKKVLAILVDMRAELVAKLRAGDVTDFTRARVNKLLSEATAIIEAAYKEMAPAVSVKGPWNFTHEDIAKILIGRDTHPATKKQEITEAKKLLKTGIPRIDTTLLHPDEVAKAWAKISKEFPDVAGSIRALGEAGEKLGHLRDTLAGFELQIGSGYARSYAKGGDLAKYYETVIRHELLHARAFALGLEKYGTETPAELHDVIDRLARGEAVSAETLKAYRGLKSISDQSTDLLGLARHEAQATASTFAAIGLEASLPTEAVLKALVNGSLIEGAKSADWWVKAGNDLAFKFAAQVRQGIAQNETMTQIVRRVAGSEKLGIPGIFEGARQNAFALVHTSVMQVASDARLATYRANSDIIKGVRQLSTMDGHTTPTCVAYSGAEWDLDGNPINGTILPFKGGPPRHWGCRSVLTSITKTFKELGIKGLPELPDTGERASDLGPIDRKTTMDQFLKMHDTEWQDKMLGKGKAQLWRDGKITLSQLVDGTGRELTLEELKAL